MGISNSDPKWFATIANLRNDDVKQDKTPCDLCCAPGATPSDDQLYLFGQSFSWLCEDCWKDYEDLPE